MFTRLYNDENLRLFAHSLPGALLVYKIRLDGSEELMFISETAEKLWEVNHDEALNNVHLLWEPIFKEDIEPMVASINKSKEEGTFWDHTYRIKTKSGKVKWLNGRAMPIKQYDGSTVWHTLILEVTDLKKLEIELKAKSNKIEHYAQKHSHDLRAPLASLLGLSNLIQEHEIEDLKEVKSIVSQLIKSSKQLDAIVREMAKDLEF